MSHIHAPLGQILDAARDLMTDAAAEYNQTGYALESTVEEYYEIVSTVALTLGDSVGGSYAYAWARVMAAARADEDAAVEKWLAYWDGVAAEALANA